MSGHDHEDGRPPAWDLHHRQRRRTIRASVYAVTLALVLWAGTVVPLPYTEFVPGSPTSIPPLLEVSGTTTTGIEGDTALLTVLLRQSTTRTAIGALLDDDRRLRPTSEVVPADVDRDDFLEQERQRFRRQFDVAAAVGAEAAGVDVSIGTVPLVVDVIDGGPSEGVLLAGDVIRRVGDDDVDGAEELQQRIREREAGDTVTVLVDRRGEHTEVEVTLAPLDPPPTTGRPDEGGSGAPEPDEAPPPGLGVLIETAADRLELPFELEIAETRIGGPSAGLMIAVTIYDLLAEEDLMAGRVVHGTGTIDAEGRVGPVGGVVEKMRSVADADVVLVPEPLLGKALAAAPEGVEVVGVATFDDALEALRDTG